MSAARAETKAINPFILGEVKGEKLPTSNDSKATDGKQEDGKSRPLDGAAGDLPYRDSEENLAGKSSVTKSKKKMKKAKRDKKKSRGGRGMFDRGFEDMFGRRGFYPGMMPFMPDGRYFYPDPTAFADMKGGPQAQKGLGDFTKFKSKGLAGISQGPPMHPGFFGQQGSSGNPQ